MLVLFCSQLDLFLVSLLLQLVPKAWQRVGGSNLATLPWNHSLGAGVSCLFLTVKQNLKPCVGQLLPILCYEACWKVLGNLGCCSPGLCLPAFSSHLWPSQSAPQMTWELLSWANRGWCWWSFCIVYQEISITELFQSDLLSHRCSFLVGKWPGALDAKIGEYAAVVSGAAGWWSRCCHCAIPDRYLQQKHLLCFRRKSCSAATFYTFSFHLSHLYHFSSNWVVRAPTNFSDIIYLFLPSFSSLWRAFWVLYSWLACCPCELLHPQEKKKKEKKFHYLLSRILLSKMLRLFCCLGFFFFPSLLSCLSPVGSFKKFDRPDQFRS